jgi:hypothetical protein
VLTGSGGERALVQGGRSLLDPHAWAIVGRGDQSMETMAQALGVALTWSLAIILLSLVFRMLRDLWRLANPQSA